jgi:hypothetical protein
MSSVTILIMTATGLLALAGIIQLLHLGGAGIRPGRMIFGAGAIILSYLGLCMLLPDPFGPGSSLFFGFLLVVAYLIVLARERRRYRHWHDYQPEEITRDRTTLRWILPFLSLGYVLALSLAVLGGNYGAGTGLPPVPSGGPGPSTAPLVTAPPIVLGTGESLQIAVISRSHARALVSGAVNPAAQAAQITDPTFSRNAPYTWKVVTSPSDPSEVTVLASGTSTAIGGTLNFTRIMPCAALVSDGSQIALVLSSDNHTWQNVVAPVGLAATCPIPTQEGATTATASGGTLAVTARISLAGTVNGTLRWQAYIFTPTILTNLGSGSPTDPSAFVVSFPLACTQAAKAVVRVDLADPDGEIGWVTLTAPPLAGCATAAPSSRH